MIDFMMSTIKVRLLALVIVNVLFQQPREVSTHGHHQMANTDIRLITFFVAEEGEAVFSEQKQDLELTVA